MNSDLRKLLAKSSSSRGLPDDDFYKNVVSHLGDSDCLINMPAGIEKTSVALSIIAQTAGRVWYVTPSLSLYRIFLLKSALPDADISFMSAYEREKPDRRLLITSPDILRDHLADIDEMSKPDLVIFEDIECLAYPEIGTATEQCLLCLPQGLPLIFLSAIANPDEISKCLAALRGRGCRVIESASPGLSDVPIFISSQWEVLPLTDKKRLNSKVRRILKEEPPFQNIRSAAFIKQLLFFLRKEELTPALIILPGEKDCDIAAGFCVQETKNAGDALTHPQIAAFLNRYPFLKDHPMLSDAVSKRTASFHGNLHPLWCELVEHLLGFRAIDAVFATAESVGEMVNKLQIAVLCISYRKEEKPREMTRQQMDVIRKRVGLRESEYAGCVALAHTSDADAVHIKDLLLQTRGQSSSAFECNCQTVLGLSAGRNDPEKLLSRTIFALKYPRFGAFCMEEFQEMLREELPEACCSGHIRAVTSLKNIRLRLTLQLDKQSRLLDDATCRGIRDRLADEQLETECLLSQLPCDDCTHSDLCHKRGTKKFRRLMECYDEIEKTLKTNITGLELDFRYYLECLREFGWTEPQHGLTESGKIAIRTGLKFPQPLTECIREGILPADDPAKSFALTGGFAEMDVEAYGVRNKESLEYKILNSEFSKGYYSELMPLYQKAEPVLSQTQERMLRFGIFLPEYMLSQAVILLAWKKGAKADTLARQTGIPVGAIMKLIRKAVYLQEQIL